MKFLYFTANTSKVNIWYFTLYAPEVNLTLLFMPLDEVDDYFKFTFVKVKFTGVRIPKSQVSASMPLYNIMGKWRGNTQE